MQHVGVPWFLVRKITDMIVGYDGAEIELETAKKLAQEIATGLDLREETETVLGANYLGGVEITRWVSGYFKR